MAIGVRVPLLKSVNAVFRVVFVGSHFGAAVQPKRREGEEEEGAAQSLLVHFIFVSQFSKWSLSWIDWSIHKAARDHNRHVLIAERLESR